MSDLKVSTDPTAYQIWVDSLVAACVLLQNYTPPQGSKGRADTAIDVARKFQAAAPH